MRKISLGLIGVLVLSAVAVGQTKAKPNVDVKRADALTPEITGCTPGSLPNGKETDVVCKGRYFPGEHAVYKAVDGCRLIKAVASGPGEVRFTVISTSEKGGYCVLRIISNGHPGEEGMRVEPSAAVAAQQKKEQEEEQAASMAKAKAAADFMKQSPEMVGKKWSVTLPNGKPDTWTWTGKTSSGGTFSSTSGDKVEVSLYPGGILVITLGKSCVFNGNFKDNKADGTANMPASMCKVGQGKWSATISK